MIKVPRQNSGEKEHSNHDSIDGESRLGHTWFVAIFTFPVRYQDDKNKAQVIGGPRGGKSKVISWLDALC